MSSKTINIPTAHNIIVSFELASASQRIIATILDLFIVLFYSIIAFSVFGVDSIWNYLVILPFFSFYHLFFEIYNDGQSPGKMFMKIQVVTLNGRTPDISAYFLRWIFRMIDVGLSFGLFGLMLISSSIRQQRIGDFIAGTTVVKKLNERKVSLKSLTKSHDLSKIEFPKLTAFCDADMLLVKQSLLRSSLYPNNANKLVLNELSTRIHELLGLEKRIVDDRKFLKQVLREYIVLTR